MGHIAEQFTRIALANCELDMTLTSNGREIHRLVGGQSLRQRIAELFSSEISENLLDVESSEKGLDIYALLGKPAISRTTNKFQYIFLNGRFIRDKFISHAVKEAYRGILEPDRFGVVFLFIQMPYEDYDVNVHPTKIEVRFYNANLVHSQMLGCLREKLLGTNLDVDIGEKERPPAARDRSQQIADAMAEFFKKHKAAQRQPQQTSKEHSGAMRPSTKETSDSQRWHHEPVSDDGQARFMQIHDSFIVAQTDDGFAIIDQHALHERIIYDDLCRRIGESKLKSQKLLIPESFELTDAQVDAIEKNTELFDRLGIELVPFGPKTMAIQAFPALLPEVSPVNFVQDLLDLLTDKAGSIDAERLLDEVLNMTACKAAIKAGQRLTVSEIEKLITDKEEAEYGSRCPHGRPTTIRFSISDLEKQFKRT
jgi:DNA mismatch repair protein MutL